MNPFKRISGITAEAIYNVHKLSEVVEATLSTQELEIYRSKVLAIAQDKILETQMALIEYQTKVLNEGCTPLKPQFVDPAPVDSLKQFLSDHPTTERCPSIVA